MRVVRWSDHAHPVWSVAKLAVIFVGVNALLYFNAQHFDRGEVGTAVGTVVIAALLEGLRPKKQKEEE
jgi:hypothetical protein